MLNLPKKPLAIDLTIALITIPTLELQQAKDSLNANQCKRPGD